MSDSRPIGMLDSGVGGFSVLRELRSTLPHESILYVADQGNLPYGPRPIEEIRQFVIGIVRFLQEQDCKAVVIACNTANAAALHAVRAAFPTLPIIGMEPAIKPAAAQTRTGVIGVLMTAATYQSTLYASVVDRFAQDVQVESQVAPRLVTLVEDGELDSLVARQTVEAYLAPLKAAQIDQLVLGCTHFPFLTPLMREVLGEGVTIIDPAPAVARQVQRVLTQQGLLREMLGTEDKVTVRYITTGEPTSMARSITRLLPADLWPATPIASGVWLSDGQLRLREA